MTYDLKYETKDSGKREVFDSGMQRDTTEGKMRPDLLFPLELPVKKSIGWDLIYYVSGSGEDTADMAEDFINWFFNDYSTHDFILEVFEQEGKEILKRYAELLARGAVKYNDRNWEKATGQAELERGKQSAFRHFVQYLCGDTDEDHIAAVLFNIQLVELVRHKMSDVSTKEES